MSGLLLILFWQGIAFIHPSLEEERVSWGG